MSIRIALTGSDEPRRAEPAAPAAEAIVAALQLAAARLGEIAPSARAGEVRGVHQLRVLCRRLRSELRAVRDLVDRGWRERLEAELKWLGNALSDVRDLDILRQRLQTAARGIAENREADLIEPLRPLFVHLNRRRGAALKSMRWALRSERFDRLTALLQAAANAPPLRKRSRKPRRKVFPPLVATAWRRLRQGARSLGVRSPDERFHDVRKRAKRTRYTAEFVAPAMGPNAEERAGRFIQLTKAVQDVLGEHQDMTIAIAEVQNFLAHHPRNPRLARAGDALLGRLHRSADATRRAFFDIWPTLDRKKLRRWMKAKRSKS